MAAAAGQDGWIPNSQPYAATAPPTGPPASASTTTTDAAIATTTTATVEGGPVEHYIFFFEYRTLFESEDMDVLNYNGWLECLSSFGYENLDLATYYKELALRSPSEVMMSLCPFTTMQEWEPALNKRDVRISRELAEFCNANAIPMGGVKEFILSTTRCAKVTVVLLSPFSEAHTRSLLDKSNLGPLVDFVIPYQSLDTAALQALEVVDIPPPKWPDHTAGMQQRWGQRLQSMRLEHPTRYVAFVSSAAHAKALARFGISAMGITYNNIDHEATEAGAAPSTARGGRPSRRVVTIEGCDPAELIVGAGLCKQVLTDFTGLTFEYLHNAAWWHTLAYQ